MIDRYTKCVLTVIALCLVWIAIRLTTVPTAQATPRTAQPVQRVHIVGIGGWPVSLGRPDSDDVLDAVPVRDYGPPRRR
jgi:hypothetical protein